MIVTSECPRGKSVVLGLLFESFNYFRNGDEFDGYQVLLQFSLCRGSLLKSRDIHEITRSLSITPLRLQARHSIIREKLAAAAALPRDFLHEMPLCAGPVNLRDRRKSSPGVIPFLELEKYRRRRVASCIRTTLTATET